MRVFAQVVEIKILFQIQVQRKEAQDFFCVSQKVKSLALIYFSQNRSIKQKQTKIVRHKP